MKESGIEVSGNADNQPISILDKYDRTFSIFQDIDVSETFGNNIVTGTLRFNSINIPVFIHYEYSPDKGSAMGREEVVFHFGDKNGKLSIFITLERMNTEVLAQTAIVKLNKASTLPKGLGKFLYEQVVFTFLDEYSRSNKVRVLHHVRHSSVNNEEISEGQWLKVFGELLDAAGYTKQRDVKSGRLQYEKEYKPTTDS